MSETTPNDSIHPTPDDILKAFTETDLPVGHLEAWQQGVAWALSLWEPK